MPMTPDSDVSVAEDDRDESEKIEQSGANVEKPKAKRRTKTGCLTCRKRRIKCGEERPICKNCIKSKRECAGYNPSVPAKQPAGPATVPHRLDPKLYGSHLAFSHQQVFPNYPILGSEFSISHQVPFTTLQRSSIVGEGFSSQVATTSTEHDTRQAVAPFSQGAWVPIAAQNLSQNIEMTDRFDNASDPSGSLSINAGLINNNFTNAYQPDFSLSPSQETANTPIVRASGARYSNHGFIQTPSFETSVKLPLETTALNLETKLEENEYDDAEDESDFRDTNGDVDVYTAEQQADPISDRGMNQEHDEHHQKDLLDSISDINDAKSPLQDEKYRRTFQHFLDVTGPCIGIFDRIDPNHPDAVQHMVWTKGLPQMALKYPALAHAILAIGALHLARLHGTSQDAAVKHFTHALCRVKHLLEIHETRVHVSTFATILLLAYYEVIAGDHSRWSLHISGAAKLVMEINFAGLVQSVKNLRREAKALGGASSIDQSSTGLHSSQHNGLPSFFLNDEDWDIDQDLISSLMGIDVDYERQTQSNLSSDAISLELITQDAESFEVLMEMYWWFCKQDLFQSLLSGDAPMLAFWKWKFCPPRGRIGIADKAYATVDHLWLVLARIMDFGYRDRKRKLQVVAANGGEWSPAPGFTPSSALNVDSRIKPDLQNEQQKHNPAPDLQAQARQNTSRPVANEGRTRKAKTTGPMAPNFPLPMYGMLPPPDGPIHMSSSFRAVEAELRRDCKQSPHDTESSSSSDIEHDIQIALDEHASISAALDKFRASLGEGFQPLMHDARFTTPFGPALTYRSPIIAAMWTFYHVAKIMLRRLHPYSPPAALVSAGFNAPATSENAQAIGRICGGLYAQYNITIQSSQQNRILVAALMETTFSLLFAAVQYVDPAQRGWTISKLSGLAQMTGWASSAAIASACEATWHKMGEAGRGPPYQRTLNRDHDDVRFGSGETKIASPAKDSSQSCDAVQEHESRFVHHDRSLIDRHTSTRTYWAMGLLSVEDDLKAMKLNESQLPFNAENQEGQL